MVKTFKELQEVDSMIGELYKKNPKLKDSKFGYAYKRFSDKVYSPVVRDFQDELGFCRVDNALEDPNTKEVLIDRMNVRGYKYSKAGLKKCMEQEKKIIEEWDEKEVEIKPFFTKDVPTELTDEDKELLKGVILE